MERVTAWFVLLAPLVVLCFDLLLNLWEGYDATITGVVRRWAEQSTWPEFCYVVGVVILYLHLFKGWPE